MKEPNLFIKFLKFIFSKPTPEEEQRQLKREMCSRAFDVCSKKCETCAWNVNKTN